MGSNQEKRIFLLAMLFLQNQWITTLVLDGFKSRKENPFVSNALFTESMDNDVGFGWVQIKKRESFF
jgi:hypothetical protein